MVIMIGAFPPPVHGMAIVNATTRERLTQVGAQVVTLNTAAPDLRRSWAARLRRLPRIVVALCILSFRHGESETLYMSMSGGLGQLYDVLFLAVGLARRKRIFVHHHSFAYLDERHSLTSIFTRLGGRRVTHVVLSNAMDKRLRSLYPGVAHTIIVSNAAILESGRAPERRLRSKVGVVGFIGNICAEKGIFEFLEVAEESRRLGMNIQFKVAGPFQDAATERDVQSRLLGIECVEYVGPKYDRDKREFFRNVDVLLFPTKYQNEAEPVTIYESLQAGAPVIAYGRGSIPEMLLGGAGLAVKPHEKYAEAAIGLLADWYGSKEFIREASERCYERFMYLHHKSADGWDRLGAIVAGTGGEGSKDMMVAGTGGKGSTAVGMYSAFDRRDLHDKARVETRNGTLG